MVGEYDERRQVFVHAPQPVADPASHARKAGHLKPRGLQQRGLTMNSRLADHIVDEGHVIHTSSQRRHHLAELLAAFAIGLKVPEGRSQGPNPF